MPYMRRKDIMEEYKCSVGFVTKIAEEMRETSIYPDDFKIDTIGELRIDAAAVKHYIVNRKRIKEGKEYPPYERTKI